MKTLSQILFVISKPDVFKSPASETYVIFGEAKIEDINSQAQQAAAEQFKTPEPAMPIFNTNQEKSAEVAEDDEEDEEGDIDESGLDADEIQTIMSQTNCSRARAVKALKQNGNIVDAILGLTP